MHLFVVGGEGESREYPLPQVWGRRFVEEFGSSFLYHCHTADGIGGVEWACLVKLGSGGGGAILEASRETQGFPEGGLMRVGEGAHGTEVPLKQPLNLIVNVTWGVERA